MSQALYPVLGFGGFSLTIGRAEITHPPSGFGGFSLTASKSEFVQQVRGFKGFSLAFIPPSRSRTFHLVPRK